MSTRILNAWVLLVVVGLAACATGGIQLFAQTLPVTDHATWTPNAASDNVTNYIVTVDTVPQNFAASACSPTLCSAPISIPAFGPHQVTIAAQNLAISDDPTSLQTGPAVSVAFTQSKTPSATTGTTVTK